MVDTSPFDSFGFQVAFACQALPTDAARHDVEYHGWSRGRHTGPWLYVEIDVSGERHWVGRFEKGPADYPFTGTFGCPHPDYLLVAASGQAYVVNARAPQGVRRLGSAADHAGPRCPSSRGNAARCALGLPGHGSIRARGSPLAPEPLRN